MALLIPFAGPRSAADALTFAQRSARLGDGYVRLRASEGILALSCAPLSPQTLLDETPTVLGMRFLQVDAELVCDLTIEAASLTLGEDPSTLVLPETAVSAPWAGVAPPRTGWTEVGTVSAATLASRAQWGISAVAQRVPTAAGEDVVRAVRSDIWGSDDDELGGLPLGVAFAAFTLGFIGGEEQAVVRRQGPWSRVTLERGHVVSRTSVRSGLTPVRSTTSRA